LLKNDSVRRLGLVLATSLLLTTGSLSAQDVASCEAGFRSFTHALGETCIPEAPQRVVVLDTGELDNALALGAPVVGAPVADATQYQAYLADQLEGITDTGSISEPNLEAILALSPDLIIGSKQRYEAIYEQLSQIAPTVFTESLRVPWQQNFNFHADALGKTAEAAELIASYDAHVADLQAALGDKLETTTISIVRFRPGQVRLYLKSSYIGYILQDVGLKRPASQDEDTFSAEISLEEVQTVDADYIFVTGYDVDDSERDTFLNSPLWQTLGAVQNGHVVDINDDTWIAGLGVQAANLVLDDLATLLVGEDTQTAATTCEEGFRLFDHELLFTDPVCIPVNPQRIVAVDSYALENLLALGVKPVASAVVGSFSVDYPQLTGLIDGVVDLGNYPPNLETMLSVQPDLILAIEPWITDQYDKFAAIAPTVSIKFDDVTPEQFLSIIAEAVNSPISPAEAIATFDARVEALGEAIAEKDRQGTVSVALFYADVLYVYPVDTAFNELPLVGLTSLPEQNEAIGSEWRIEVSKEQLPLLNTDYIFLVTFATSAEEEAANGEMIARLNEDPIWQTLKAVQNDNVFVVQSQWITGTLLSEHKVLDDVFTDVAQVDPAEVSPNPFLSAEAAS